MAGLYFEDFEVGQEFSHALTRTVTEMDNTLFSLLTLNPQPPRPSSASVFSTASIHSAS
jgi:acyl dehydratase